jgi:hypothetical protein
MPHAARRALVCASLFVVTVAVPAGAHAQEPPAGQPGPARPALPPPPEGVAPLEFSEFFERPVGPRGLVFTAKLQKLNAKRVRILGYMVRRDAAPEGSLILTPRPVLLHDIEYGLADDLPPSALYVTVPEEREVPYTPGLLLLTGRLEIGNREEKDGRVSVVRLLLDPKPEGRDAASGPVVVVPGERR